MQSTHLRHPEERRSRVSKDASYRGHPMNQSDIRAIALSLPEAEEHPHFDKTSFRVRGKIFSTLTADGEQVMVKLPLEIKAAVEQAHPEAFVPLPGAWGRSGATLLVIAAMKDDTLADLVRLAWRQVAPKTLLTGGMA